MQVSPWILLVGLAGGFIIFRIAASKLSGVTQVSAATAEELISQQDAVVLDVRTHDEYSAGRIPKARHVPLSQINARLKELDKYRGRSIIVSCRSGARSARACKVLKKNGFEDVYNLKGGIRSWARARHTIES